jgi:hypothetical protein
MYNSGVINRRKRALLRLQKQLISGAKSTNFGQMWPLTDEDKERIKSEIQTLKSRV